MQMRKAAAIFLLLCSLAYGKGAHRNSSSSSSGSKTVHVRGYTRKDGTSVAPYDRSVPSTTTPSYTRSSTPYRKDYLAKGYTAHPTVQRDKHGRIKRSAAAKSAFEHQHPCPSTGRISGSCPGHVVDHVTALECGGADDPTNMQWQTTADAKAKDRTERACRL